MNPARFWMSSLDDLRDKLNFDDHTLWLFIGVAVAALFTIQAIESAIETAWPHERRPAGIVPGARRAQPVWGIVGLLVLPGAILALMNLGTILWNDAESTRTMTIGGVLLIVGWAVFMLSSMNWLGVRNAIRETGAIGPIALALLLLVADLMLLAAFIDIAPSFQEVIDGIKNLIPFLD
jgi:hypothetical protein